MKKRLLAILMIVGLLLSFVSCGNNGNELELAKDVSMLALFSPMLKINEVPKDDVVVAYYGNCPIYRSFLINEGETVSEDGTAILGEYGVAVATMAERCSVFAYAMSACVFNYISGIEIDTKILYSYAVYQTEYLRAAGYPDSALDADVDSLVSDETAYLYLESFIKSGVETLIKGDESLREKATNFVYDQLIADGTLNADRTFTDSGRLNYKRQSLVTSQYAYLAENKYVEKIDALVEEHYSFGAKK
jgi:hypothetical protein